MKYYDKTNEIRYLVFCPWAHFLFIYLINYIFFHIYHNLFIPLFTFILHSRIYNKTKLGPKWASSVTQTSNCRCYRLQAGLNTAHCSVFGLDANYGQGKSKHAWSNFSGADLGDPGHFCGRFSALTKTHVQTESFLHNTHMINFTPRCLLLVFILTGRYFADISDISVGLDLL